MSLFVGRLRRKRRDGSSTEYYDLRANVWDRERQSTKQVYIGHIGADLTITKEQAEQLAAKASERLGETVTVDDLRDVRRLRIAEEADQDA